MEPKLTKNPWLIRILGGKKMFVVMEFMLFLLLMALAVIFRMPENELAWGFLEKMFIALVVFNVLWAFAEVADKAIQAYLKMKSEQ